MYVKIGNIPPMTDIEISFSYTERVEVYLNKFWRFRIFALFVNSYFFVNNPKLENILENLADSERLTFDLKVVINSRQPFSLVKAIPHEVEIIHSKIGNLFSAQISLSSNKRYVPNQDFVLLYATKGMNQPHYLLSPFEYGYCMLLNFIPDLSSLSFEDSFRAANQGKLLSEVLIAQAKREFILVVDETKYYDEPIFDLLKETLTFFMKKLPDNSYFNIIGISQKSVGYASKSIKVTEDSLNDALNDIDLSYKSLGCVELPNIIQFIKNAEDFVNYTRKIFVLTSRLSTRSANITIQALQNKLPREEIFLLEIRPPSFFSYLGKVALHNKHIHEIIRSKEDMPEKVSHILRNSLLPHFTDFNLKIEDESLCAYIIPVPRALSSVSPNKLVEFFIIFNKKLLDVKKTNYTLKFFNSQNNSYENFKGEINIENADPSEAVIKLGMSKFCESLSIKRKIFKDMNNNMAQAFRKDVSQKLLATSLRHGILTSKTAFVCLVEKSDDALKQIPTVKITTLEIKEGISKAYEEFQKSSRPIIVGTKPKPKPRPTCTRRFITACSANALLVKGYLAKICGATRSAKTSSTRPLDSFLLHDKKIDLELFGENPELRKGDVDLETSNTQKTVKVDECQPLKSSRSLSDAYKESGKDRGWIGKLFSGLCPCLRRRHSKVISL